MAEPQFASWAAAAAVSAGLSAGLIALIKPILVRHLLAHPNHRSSHETPTPQGAGMAVIASVVAVTIGAGLLGLAPPPPSLVPVLCAAAVLTVMGALDDAHALAVSWRLLAQLLAAIVVVVLLPEDFRILPGLLPMVVERGLLAFGVVGFVNAINFLDGLDWMIVVQVIPMSLGVAIMSALGLVPANIGLLAMVLLGAMVGFAVFNKHPAQIFLGDAGSLPIGLVLAFLLIFVAGAHVASAILLALYSLADTIVTFGLRWKAGEHVFSAHRSHFYQRAVAAGLQVPQVTARVLWLCVWLMTLAIAAALANSLTFDITALVMGIAVTAFVLRNFTRGR